MIRPPRAIVTLSLLALVTGCQWLTIPRTHGPIHFVAIEDRVSETDLRTRAGDEVRWVNVRPAPVAVIFSGLARGDLSCRRGFSRDEAERIAAIIFPDSHASLCFSKAGRMTYRVVEINRPDVEFNQTATIRVVGQKEWARVGRPADAGLSPFLWPAPWSATSAGPGTGPPGRIAPPP